MTKPFLYILLFIFIWVVFVAFWTIITSISPRRYVSNIKPSDLGLEYKEFDLITSDNIRLKAWFIPKKQSPAPYDAGHGNSCIIICHGYPFDKGNVLGFAPFLHKKYNVFLFDFRAMGESGGRISTVGLKETRDLEAAIDYLKKEKIEKIGVLGFSLGGAVAIMTKNSNINAIVSESSFADLNLLLYDMFRHISIFKYPVVAIIKFFTKVFMGLDVMRVSPREAIKWQNCPILLIHAQKDSQIPLNHAKLLHNAGGSSQLWIAPECDHGQPYFVYQREYEEKVLEFFDRAFKNKESIKADNMPELEKNLRDHVFMLSEKIGERSIYNYDKMQEAAGYIDMTFIKYGYKVESQRYILDKKEYRNIIVTKLGTSKSREVIIIGAHYDTVAGSPGADDNASAVAGLLEIARELKDKPTERTIKFIAFAIEEPPIYMSNYMGSSVYARAARKRKEDIRAFVCLESIGYYTEKPGSQAYPMGLGLFYPNKGNYIAVVGNFASTRLVNQVKNSIKNNCNVPVESISAPSLIPGIDFSDHRSFWKERYRAVMITDTAFYRNPNYHMPTDRFDTLDYKRLTELVKGLSKVMAELSN